VLANQRGCQFAIQLLRQVEMMLLERANQLGVTFHRRSMRTIELISQMQDSPGKLTKSVFAHENFRLHRSHESQYGIERDLLKLRQGVAEDDLFLIRGGGAA